MKQNPNLSPKGKKQKTNQKTLVLLNDDFNTFDHVIDCLTVICEHNPIQAEQCAVITHYNGSCVIKLGEITDLLALQSDLEIYNLDAEII
ncbi:MAG: ATP-dependent Clp protease adaptor ClpS [Flavobacteriales bacterium]|nr:ATP-dependent Clp protease adaptor ClpS [Flavobacteriales bacterium]